MLGLEWIGDGWGGGDGGVDNTFLTPQFGDYIQKCVFFFYISLSFFKGRPISLIHKYLLFPRSGGKTQQYLNRLKQDKW